ncbi:MAG: beta-propeller fold lactonase family protein [Pirellulales bacterium]|nr:beta-propeller fold lactonase family protein [Pirellulales bacterium]
MKTRATFRSTWILLCPIAAVLAAPMRLAGEEAPGRSPDQEQVGHAGEGRAVTPVNQILTPLGRQLDLAGMRPQTLALSPDGTRLAVAGKTSELVMVDPAAAEVVQRVALPNEKQQLPEADVASPNILHPDDEGQASFTGLIYSHDGRRILMSNVEGSVKVFAVAADGTVKPSHSWPLPAANAPRRDAEIPSGLALSKDDQRLYVCGNLSNQLLELDAHTGKVLRKFAAGVAPYDVALAGDRAFVSNWGGRRPGEGDLTGPAGRGTEVRVDPVRHIASEGSVSVIDLKAGKPIAELLTGLHACGLAVSPDERYVVCANSGSDHLSVIDVQAAKVVETMWAKPKPSDLLGASPNALAFDPSGKRLYAANGSQNAIAVFDFDPQDKGESRLRGMLPVGWYPGALVFDAQRKALVAANVKGLPKTPRTRDDGVRGFNSHQYSGSLSLVPLPTDDQLPQHSEVVSANMRLPRIAAALAPPRKDQPPRAVPQRIGEPSFIKHVVYIIKENRTYDQVLGDVERGNGDASLCIFGGQTTPNQHKLADQFVLLDNTYCAGILSADGHQWSTTAFSTDYMEKSFAGFPRSYPDGMGEDENDALAYSPAGFIWDNALQHHTTIRNYGEFMMPKVRWADASRRRSPDFTACYNQWKNNTGEVVFESEPSVETLRSFSPSAYVGWAMEVPDQYRADFILRELAEYEKQGEFPNLTIICLPNDHTSGTSPGSPTPRACAADNDLAFGRIIEGLSHSKFWKEMAIFSIEDDPQAGWDHVSGYRTTAYVASPYAKRGAVVSTQYNTTSILRTIEQILGMAPMNQFDASAEPMFDCFADTPDYAPYNVAAATIALNEMNPPADKVGDAVLRQDALASATLNFREIDRAPEDVLNRILWRSVRGSAEPYPEWAISAHAEEEEEEEEEEMLERLELE